MPSVSFFKTLASVINFHPGDVANFTWNNTPVPRIVVFDVEPFLITLDPGNWAQGQVTQVFRSITQNAHTQQVHVQVKNTGGVNMNCDVYMAQIAP
jgi:hypothetical protein